MRSGNLAELASLGQSSPLMSGRRLPLHSRSQTSQHAHSNAALGAAQRAAHEPVLLSGRVVAVADTSTCALAMRWAARLVVALAEHGVGAHVALTSFDAELTVDADARKLFAPARSVECFALGAVEVAGWLAPRDSSVLWVLVGQPALLAYRAPLSVLLDVAAPVLRWPDSMRALRGSCTLEVSGDGLSLCAPLAGYLGASHWPAPCGRQAR